MQTEMPVDEELGLRKACRPGAVAASPHLYAPGRLSKEAEYRTHGRGEAGSDAADGYQAGGTQYRSEMLASRQQVTQDLGDLNVPSQKLIHSLALSGSPTQPFEPEMKAAERRDGAGSRVFLLGAGGPHDGILFGPSSGVHG